MILISTENVHREEIQGLKDHLQDNYWKFSQYDGVHGKYDKHREIEEHEDITVIDNSQKVIMLLGDKNKQMFVNLKDVEKAYNSFKDKSVVRFFYFYNNKQTRLSRYYLAEWLKDNQMNYKFI